jgi:hypothetical protein
MSGNFCQMLFGWKAQGSSGKAAESPRSQEYLDLILRSISILTDEAGRLVFGSGARRFVADGFSPGLSIIEG